MNRVLIRTIVLCVVLGSVSVFAMAKGNKKQVTFSDPVMVSGTLVKAGTYDVAFDDQTGQLTIFRGKKVLATAAAKLEKPEKNTGQVYAVWAAPGGATDAAKILTSVTLRDGSQAKIANTGQMNAE